MATIFDITMPTALSQVLDAALAWVYGFQPMLEPTVVLGKFRKVDNHARILQVAKRFFDHSSSAFVGSSNCSTAVGEHWL
jgi:hypothetical protein